MTTKEVGRAPFTSRYNEYGNDTEITLVFFDDGSIRWEPPADDNAEFGLPPRSVESLFAWG